MDLREPVHVALADYIHRHDWTEATVALESPGRAALSFGALGTLIDRTADTLVQCGIRAGSRVAIVLPNGPELATTLVSVMSTASAVPLNPALTTTEYEHVFTATRLGVLIVDREDHAAATAARRCGLGILLLRREASAGDYRLERGPAIDNVPTAPSHDPHVALVLHTSGTTSSSKIVPIHHRNLAASVANVSCSLALAHQDRYLGVLPLHHISGIVALLASWSVGSVVLYPSSFTAAQFLALIEELQPTWITAVPTLLDALAARARAATARPRHRLRLVRSAAAPLKATVIAELETLFGVPVIESYGMTETTSQATANPLPPAARKVGSVGLPTGVDVAIVDGHGNILPSNTQGEIVIRGPSVVAGYDRAEDTRAAFKNGWLHTGDIGFADEERYLFVTGRLKEIINVGGEKVSPAEVEEVLATHPAVAEAVAFPLGDDRLGESVAAAVVLAAGAETTETELREHAARHLALFKVPAIVRFVDHVPRTSTGKAMRVGLADTLGLTPITHASAQPAGAAGSLTTTGVYVAELWKQLLRIDRVGSHDNFFALGGDSLAAAEMLIDASNRFGVELGYLTLMSNPTVAAFAAAIESSSSSAPVDRATRASGRGEYPLTLEQHWFYRQLDRSHPAFRIGRSLHLRGPLDAVRLVSALREIVERHQVLSVTIPDRAGPPRQVVDRAWDVSVSNVTDDAALLACERDVWQRGFQLERESAFRAHLLRRDDTEHVLVLAAHHITFDASSWRVLFDELAAAHAGKLLPPLEADYLGFAEWQDAACRRGDFADSFAYWRAVTPRHVEVAARMHRDHAAAAGATYHPLAVVSHVIEHAELARLRDRVRKQQTTLYSLSLTAFLLALRSLGGDEVAVATPSRNRAAPKGVMGVFNQIPSISVELPASVSGSEALARVQAALLDIAAHPHLPPADGISPVLPCLFVYNVNMAKPPQLPGVEARFRPVARDSHQRELLVMSTEEESVLRFDFAYARTLFDEETIRALATRFADALQTLVDSPTRSLADPRA